MTRAGKTALAAVLIAFGLAVAPAASAGPVRADRSATSARVTNGNPSGPGSFANAVQAANADDGIGGIVFDSGLTATVPDSIVFTGAQRLSIDGNGSTVSGAGAEPDHTWDGGLFVSAGASTAISIRGLTFADSFNNGVAVLVPAGQEGVVQVTLREVTVEAPQFHGVLVDAQETTGYNTDDIPHPSCVDPHPSDSLASVSVSLTDVTVTGAGTLDPGFDTSIETGCPQDFDGVRVDEGGEGSLTARIVGGHFDGNLADGIELDESQSGTVAARVVGATFNGNGETMPVTYEGDTVVDLDDGFDIDETGPGGLIARFVNTEVIGNFDEGLDFDEAGSGDVDALIVGTTAEGNEDENMKADEKDAGDLRFDVRSSSASMSASQDGVQVEEAGDGDLVLSIRASTMRGNDGDGVRSDEGDEGDLVATVVNSDLSGNPGGSGTDIGEDGEGIGTVVITSTDLSGNGDGATTNDVDSEILRNSTLDGP